MKDTIYIKGCKNTTVSTSHVRMGQIVKIHCANKQVLPALKAKEVCHMEKGESRVLITAYDIVEKIQESYPQMQVENLGETDFLITYEKEKKTSKWLQRFKESAVLVITFFGTAYSVMAFHNDVETSKLFAQIYYLFTGKISSGFTILEQTYCIGMGLGILLFFHPFGKGKEKGDPTPMEIEMQIYEEEIEKTLLQTLQGEEKADGK